MIQPTLAAAEWVVEQIIATDWSVGQLPAVLSYSPRVRSEDVPQARAFVVPGDYSLEVVNRGADHEIDHEVSVGVFQAVGTPTSSTIGDLIGLVYEMALHFARSVAIPPPFGRPMIARAITIEPLYDQELLEQEGVFASIFTISYQDYDQ